MGGLALLFILLGSSTVSAASVSPGMPRFQFEQQAQQHCPTDAVVWVVESRGSYNSSQERWYGRTSNGAYACLRDAVKAGYRANLAAAP